MYKYTVLLAIMAVTLVNSEDIIFNSDIVTVNKDTLVDLDCGTRQDYHYCMWEHNNDIIQVKDVHAGVYKGMSKPNITDDNQCGIVLDSANIEDHGTWTCIIFISGSSLAGSKNIRIMMKPSNPLLSPDIIKTNTTQKFEAMCSVFDARPAADITWFVGDLEITSDAEAQINFLQSKGTYSTVSTLRHKFRPEENGQQLICKVDHPTQREPVNSSLDIAVLFAPVEKPMQSFFNISQGTDYEIRFNFTANPAPTNVMWKHGESDDGIVITDVTGEGELFSVLINNIKVSEKDFDRNYQLFVENEIGSTEYQFRLLPPDKETMDASRGVIAAVITENEIESTEYQFSLLHPDKEVMYANHGVIAAVITVVFAVIVLLYIGIVYTRHRQMLCFSVSTC